MSATPSAVLKTIDGSSADRLMAGAGKTFHRAARLLPAAVREDVVRLYAFCRQVDDLADEPGATVADKRREFASIADAFGQQRLPELLAAGWPFAADGTLAQAARLLVCAAAADLDQRQPQTPQDLLDYAFGVAGTVGMMMAEVLEAVPSGMGAAVALGMAMQLSNIARDVAEDLHNDRMYLPARWAPAPAIRAALFARDPESLQTVLSSTRQVLALAETLYEAAFDGIGSLPWRTRWSILAAALCYREIGREVARQGSHSWTKRVVISTPRKLWLIAVAGLKLLRPRFWWPRRRTPSPVLGQLATAAISHLGFV